MFLIHRKLSWAAQNILVQAPEWPSSTHNMVNFLAFLLTFCLATYGRIGILKKLWSTLQVCLLNLSLSYTLCSWFNGKKNKIEKILYSILTQVFLSTSTALSRKQQSGRKETVLDLAKFVDKGVQVKLTGGRQGYPNFFHLLIC